MTDATPNKELEALLSALFEGELNAEQGAQLETLLKNSADARRVFLEYCEMHSMLQWEHGVLGGVGHMPADAAKAKVAQPKKSVVRLRFLAFGLGIAAMVVVAVLIALAFQGSGKDESLADVAPEEYVGRLTASKECRWVGQNETLQAGDYLRRGRQLELQSGFAEITFDSGAQVVLEGPAALDLNSAWEAQLRHGTLKANVPAEAIGFRIASPSVEVVDLGTEFSMVTDELGATEVFVLKGSVQAAAKVDKQRPPAILLKEHDARRFFSSGTSEVKDRERKVARWAKPEPLNRYVAPGDYVHWSFDESNTKVARADVNGTARAAFDAHFKTSLSGAASYTEGRWGQALHFDGDLFARIPFPNISNNTAHSIAFWMRLPDNVPISDGDTVLAWTRKEHKKGGARAVQIGWNSNPAQGSVGTLRTEAGRGVVTGSTPLRDGRWHHVAVVFVPGENGGPVHVSQYVDGRLDGVSSTRNKERRPAETADLDEAGTELVWLGRGIRTQKREKFHGDLDELYIFERALAPYEILHMLKENTPSAGTVAEN